MSGPDRYLGILRVCTCVRIPIEHLFSAVLGFFFGDVVTPLYLLGSCHLLFDISGFNVVGSHFWLPAGPGLFTYAFQLFLSSPHI